MLRLILFLVLAASAVAQSPVPSAGTLTAPAGSTWTFATPRTTRLRLVAQGTTTQPVRLAGGELRHSLEVQGTCLVIEGVRGVGASVWFLGGSEHVTLQDSTFTGRKGSVLQLAPASNQPTEWIRHIAIERCSIVDNGTVAWDDPAGGDPDNHGIVVGRRCEDVTVSSCVITRNAGNGIQINGGVGGQLLTRRIAVTGCAIYGNRQSAIAVKQSADVLVLGNQLFENRKTFSDYGAGVTLNYNPQRVWILNNDIWGSVVGVRDAGGAVGVEVIGNRFTDITGGTFTPNGVLLPGRAIWLPDGGIAWQNEHRRCAAADLIGGS